MVESPTRLRLLRLQVLLQYLLATVLLGLAATQHSSALGLALRQRWNVHKLFKGGVEVWGLLLLYHRWLPWVLLAGALTGLGAGLLRGRSYLPAAVLLVLAVSFVPGAQPVLLLALALLLAINLLPWRPQLDPRSPWLRALWLPGLALLAPVPSLRLLMGLRSRAWRPVLGALLGLALAGAAFVGSVAAMVEPGKHQWDFIYWDESMVDPRVQVVARSPDGYLGDFHEIQVIGQQAVVAAESGSIQLVPLTDQGEHVYFPIPPRQLDHGDVGSVSSWTQPGTGRTWVMDGFRSLRVLDISSRGFADRGQIGLPVRMNFPYFRYAPELERLLLVEVSALDGYHGQITYIDPAGIEPPRHCYLTDAATGQPRTAPRNAVWVPSIGKLVISPDYDPWLYAVDPGTCTVEPWLDTGEFNGRIRWVDAWGRLVLAKPGERYVEVVDPAGPSVERRIPTQPGVRVLAVDTQRDLLVTASVITGRLQVQRASDGQRVDSFSTLMPMARSIALDPATGQALLSTWTVLYRVPYAN